MKYLLIIIAIVICMANNYFDLNDKIINVIFNKQDKKNVKLKKYIYKVVIKTSNNTLLMYYLHTNTNINYLNYTNYILNVKMVNKNSYINNSNIYSILNNTYYKI
jgi:hypothetical protein